MWEWNNAGYHWVPDGWERTMSFLSQAPPWLNSMLMAAVIFMVLLLLLVQWRMQRALARRRGKRTMAMYIKFKMGRASRMEYLRSICAYHLTSGLEDDFHEGRIDQAEKDMLYQLFAEGKPKLVELRPRKQDKLTWRARNFLIETLKKAQAARKTTPEKPIPFPDLDKKKVWGTGKLAKVVHASQSK